MRVIDAIFRAGRSGRWEEVRPTGRHRVALGPAAVGSAPPGQGPGRQAAPGTMRAARRCTFFATWNTRAERSCAMVADTGPEARPIVLITGAAGAIGSALAVALEPDYAVVGLDLEGSEAPVDCIAIDLTSDDSVELAMRKLPRALRQAHRERHASGRLLRLHRRGQPALRAVNVEGTRRLLRALQDFEVEQFVYSGTMLVHAPGEPGERINEDQPDRAEMGLPQIQGGGRGGDPRSMARSPMCCSISPGSTTTAPRCRRSPSRSRASTSATSRATSTRASPRRPGHASPGRHDRCLSPDRSTGGQNSSGTVRS